MCYIIVYVYDVYFFCCIAFFDSLIKAKIKARIMLSFLLPKNPSFNKIGAKDDDETGAFCLRSPGDNNDDKDE